MGWDACAASKTVREGASEEDPEVRKTEKDGDNGEFTVCWDPLDGSSIVDNNWAVGTMIGIWPKKTGLIGATGRDQVTSLVAIYGPRTTVLVALDDGTYEFSYGCTPEGSEEEEFLLTMGYLSDIKCAKKAFEKFDADGSGYL